MEPAELHRRGVAGLKQEIELFGHAEPAMTIELPGIFASLSPRTPDRSLFNSVAATDASALSAAIDELASIYEDAGVNAWTVWVPDHDRESAGLLEKRGHLLDGSPRSMGLELSDLRPPTGPFPPGVELVEVEIAEAGRINDLAYGIEGPGWQSSFGRELDLPHRLLGAKLGGEIVSCAIALEAGDDVCITGVATVPEQRGQGLAAAIVYGLLHEYRDRGIRTATLQASQAGAPVYERLGFSDVGFIELWELRKPG